MAESNNFFTLLNALLRGDARKITTLVHSGIDVNRCDSMGRTIIHLCASMPARMGMIEHLVKLGANINARDLMQATPIHYVFSRQANSALLEMAECNLSNTWGHELDENLNLIVMEMVQKMRIGMIDCLIKLGADVNAKLYMPTTSLHRAIRRRNIPAVKVLATLGKAGLINEREIISTLLHTAVDLGEKEVMKHLVQSGADVNAFASKCPALNAAVRSGNLEIVQTLLKHGAYIESADISNITPSAYLLELKHTKLFDLGIFTCLAHLGADFNLPTVSTKSVYEAMLLDKLAILNCLIKHGIDISNPTKIASIISPLILSALHRNEFELVEHLVQCGADINLRFYPPSFVQPIIDCARQGNKEKALALVRLGLDINNTAYHSEGITILNHLLLSGALDKKDDLVKRLTVLLRHGADVNTKHNLHNALTDAVAQGDVSMVQFLVKIGADVNRNRSRGYTAIDTYALQSGMHQSQELDDEYTIKGLECLVEAGADVNSRTDEITPLLLAVENSDTRMVETLCSLGADVNQSVGKGSWQLIGLACNQNKIDMLEYLIEHGATSERSQCTDPPLFKAVTRSDTEMVQCLLNHGARKELVIAPAKSNALDIAIQEGNADAFKCLLKAGVKFHSNLSSSDKQLNEEARRVAENFGIPLLPQTTSLLAASLTFGVDSNMIQILLSLGANTPHLPSILQIPVGLNENLTELFPSKEFLHVSSNLHFACMQQDLDKVRMLIIDGSDVHQCNSLGMQPFDCLPLALHVDYHTLRETRTTKKVMERVGQDFTPILPDHRIESLLNIPGLGDVKSILQPNIARISEGVQFVVTKIVKECKPSSKLISCGSAAEGTKVGLPDEMDFLAEVDQLGKAEQIHLKGAKHDYVRYENQHKFATAMQGSKLFHVHFTHPFRAAAARNGTHQFHEIFLRIQIDEKFVQEMNRKATSPLLIRCTNENEMYSIVVSVDVVPSIHIDGWPEGGVQETWLLSQEELRKYGYYIVPKPPHINSSLAKEYSQDELQSLWKLSWPHLETYHMQRLEKRVKDVYLLAKCLRNPDVCRIMVTDEGSYPLNVDKYITSYMLKMIVFRNVEDFRRSDLSLGEMVCQVFDQVEEGLVKESRGEVGIPLYFMPKVSALAGHKVNFSKSVRVAKIMKKFVHALYLRDCQQDLCGPHNEEEVVKPTSVYRCIEIEPYDLQHLEQRVKDVYRLAKYLRNLDVCHILITEGGSDPKTVDKHITSYMLRKVIFKNAEDFQRSDLSLGEMVCQVFDKLEEGLSKEFLILYSLPKGRNVAGHIHIPKCAKVAKIMKDFVHRMYMRDCQQDPRGIDDVEEVIIYQRKPPSVYKGTEIEPYDLQHLEQHLKDVYELAKYLRNPDVCHILITDERSDPKTVDNYITSYMLGKVIFKNAEDFQRSDLSLGEMVCRVFDKLEEGLSKGCLIRYSLPKLNIPKCAKVAEIMKKFVHRLYMRDFQQDPCGLNLDDGEESILYQRKPNLGLYRCIEIGSPEEMPLGEAP